MKKMKQMLCLTIVLLVSYLGAVNHMPLLCTMYGEFLGAHLGKGLASLDFNGDGIDDLVILESLWNPDGTIDSPPGGFYGRLNFHWGGDSFNADFDASIHGGEGDFTTGIVIALGDINNDGKDDLGYYGYVGGGRTRSVFRIYFGRTEPSPTPDYELRYTWAGGCESICARPLGDINGDGYDDVGIFVQRRYFTDSELFILDGYSMGLISAGTLISGGYPSFIGGIGDVNADGYDDYLVSRVLQSTWGEHHRITLFFGGENISSPDSLVITEDTNMLTEVRVGPLGDLNGDGIDDFLAWVGGGAFRIWYGSSALTSQWDLYISDNVGYTYNPRTYNFIHGDFNGDGYSDIISSNPNSGGHGRAFMWLGGANMNGTCDLVFNAPPSISEKFGWEKVAGDFNNDGFCDVAISQPYADPAPHRTPGRVHVYLGNAELTDTTVSNEDDTIPPVNESSMWDISLSPNPVSIKDQDIKIHFTGSGFKELQNAKIEIFNLRGQMISDYTVDRASLANGQYSAKLHNLNSGVYFLRVSRQGGSFATHRFIVK